MREGVGWGMRVESGVQEDGGAVQLADNEAVFTPAPLSISLFPCVCQMVHNRLVIRRRGLRLCTHAIFVA